MQQLSTQWWEWLHTVHMSIAPQKEFILLHKGHCFPFILYLKVYGCNTYGRYWYRKGKPSRYFRWLNLLNTLKSSRREWSSTSHQLFSWYIKNLMKKNSYLIGSIRMRFYWDLAVVWKLHWRCSNYKKQRNYWTIF